MRTYNRSLDYVALAMNELRAGKTTLAARLLATAVKQPDAEQGIAILEASNKYAFELQAKTKTTQLKAKRRITASEEGFDEDGMGEGEMAADLSEDPLDDVEDEGIEADADDLDIEDDEELDADFEDADDEEDADDAAATMAKVLSSMRRTQKRSR